MSGNLLITDCKVKNTSSFSVSSDTAPCLRVMVSSSERFQRRKHKETLKHTNMRDMRDMLQKMLRKFRPVSLFET